MSSKRQGTEACCDGPDQNAEKVELTTTGCCGPGTLTENPRVTASRIALGTGVMITRASAEDLGSVLKLLESLQLPTAGGADHFGGFFIARGRDGELAGAIGLERYGTLGLLRSASVTPGKQRSGVGSQLTTFLIDFAKGEGLEELVLFTPSARDFFARFGFVPANREDYRTQLRASSQWGDCACCSSNVFMRLELRQGSSCGCAGHSTTSTPKTSNPRVFDEA